MNEVDAFGRMISRDRRITGDNEDSRRNRNRRSESPVEERYNRGDSRNRGNNRRQLSPPRNTSPRGNYRDRKSFGNDGGRYEGK